MPIEAMKSCSSDKLFVIQKLKLSREYAFLDWPRPTLAACQETAVFWPQKGATKCRIVDRFVRCLSKTLPLAVERCIVFAAVIAHQVKVERHQGLGCSQG